MLRYLNGCAHTIVLNFTQICRLLVAGPAIRRLLLILLLLLLPFAPTRKYSVTHPKYDVHSLSLVHTHTRTDTHKLCGYQSLLIRFSFCVPCAARVYMWPYCVFCVIACYFQFLCLCTLPAIIINVKPLLRFCSSDRRSLHKA